MVIKNGNWGFDYDLDKARLHGNIFERIFHENRLHFWLSAVDYSGKKVLDVGCNTGILLIPLLEKGVDIKGVDISKEDVSKARKNLNKKDFSEKKVKVADAERLPFKEKSFDIVLLSDILEHVKDPRKVASEAVRVVKRKGIILVTVPNELHPVVKYPWVRKILTGRKDVEEHLDVPFTFEKLIKLFPKTKIIKKGYIGFWSEIFGMFQKT